MSVRNGSGSRMGGREGKGGERLASQGGTSRIFSPVHSVIQHLTFKSHNIRNPNYLHKTHMHFLFQSDRKTNPIRYPSPDWRSHRPQRYEVLPAVNPDLGAYLGLGQAFTDETGKRASQPRPLPPPREIWSLALPTCLHCQRVVSRGLSDAVLYFWRPLARACHCKRIPTWLNASTTVT
jgi:hypothetical protein